MLSCSCSTNLWPRLQACLTSYIHANFMLFPSQHDYFGFETRNRLLAMKFRITKIWKILLTIRHGSYVSDVKGWWSQSGILELTDSYRSWYVFNYSGPAKESCFGVLVCTLQPQFCFIVFVLSWYFANFIWVLDGIWLAWEYVANIDNFNRMIWRCNKTII